MSADLLPCPFCNSEVTLAYDEDGCPFAERDNANAALYAGVADRTPAATASTIDTPEFQKLLDAVYAAAMDAHSCGNDFGMDEKLVKAETALIAHIDSRTPAAPVVAEGLGLNDDELRIVKAAKRIMVDSMIQSNLAYDKCGTISYHLENLIAALAAHPVAGSPAEAHPDDIAVDRFAAAMKAKMAKSRAQGRWGWNDTSVCPAHHLQSLLRNHVGKGDPVDVGNFAMMLFNRGERTAAGPMPASTDRSDWSRQELLDEVAKLESVLVLANRNTQMWKDRAEPMPASDKHLPGWERGIATVTMNGHQLREALEFIAPGPDADPDELDNELTFGIVQHADDDGKVTAGLCCWNDDTDGVMPLDDEPCATAAPVPASEAASQQTDQAHVMPPFAAPAEQLDAARTAIIEALSQHRMVRMFEVEDDGLGNSYPLIDRLALDGAGDIESGTVEIEAIADAVLDALEDQCLLAGSAKGGITNDSTTNLAAPAVPTDAQQNSSSISSNNSTDAKPVAIPELRNAFMTLESNGGEGRTIVLKFNQRSDAYAVHDFLLNGGTKADPAAQSVRDAAQPTIAPDHDEAVILLSAVFEAWENGDACYEEPDTFSGYLGTAFQLDDDVFKRCCDLLNRLNPPRNVPTTALEDKGNSDSLNQAASVVKENTIAPEDVRDAQRYRWLRNVARSVDWSRNWVMGYSTFCRASRDQMDGDIDDAIAATATIAPGKDKP